MRKFFEMIRIFEKSAIYLCILKMKMKAYQVFTGEQDKHGRQGYELVATYLSKEKALAHAEQIALNTPLYGDVLEFDGWYAEGKCASWSAVGWEHICISMMEEIDITE